LVNDAGGDFVSKGTILIVDDEKEIRKLIARYLKVKSKWIESMK